MKSKRFLALITICITLVPSAIAQAASSQEPADKAAQEEAKKKALALVDEIIKESQGLKVAENRIRIQAALADMLWKHNEKRARELMKQATDGYIGIMADSPALYNEGIYSSSGLPYPGIGRMQDYMLMEVRSSLRQQILDTLARYDAKLARNFLRASSKPDGREGNYESRVYEAELDLNLAAKLTENDPAQALEIAEESLSKGLNHGLLQVLDGLQKKDKTVASKLLDSIVKKLKTENLQKNYSAASMILALLGGRQSFGPYDPDDEDDEDDQDDSEEASSQNLEALDDKTVRDLIDLLVAAALKQGSETTGGAEEYYEGPSLLSMVESLMPQIQKHTPARAAELQKMIEERRKKLSPQAKERERFREVLEASDPQAALEAAANAPPEMKMALTEAAVTKAITKDELDRAKQLINDRITDPEQRKQILARMEMVALQQAIEKGKLDEARGFLSGLAPLERAALLVQIAAKALEKKDKKSALEILAEAQGLFTSQPANFAELLVQLQMAGIYSALEPARSFEIIEQAVDQLNPLVGALAMLEGFDLIRSFKDGELIGTGQSPVLMCAFLGTGILSQLARGDFDRARAVAEKFTRADVRILARLAVAQGVLGNQKELGYTWQSFLMQYRSH